MKKALLAASALLTLTLVPLEAQSAPDSSFYCGTYQGSPATMAKTSRGNIPIIVWKSQAFAGSGFTPQKRCGIVSQKFQKFNQSGALKYLTTDNVNRLNVLCAVPTKKACAAPDILLTLENNDNPQQVLKDLLKVRYGASGALVKGKIWIDMDDFLENTPVHQDTDFTIPSQPVTPQAPTSSSIPPLW